MIFFLNTFDKTLDLGVYLDFRLTFKSHIDYVVNRANSTLGFIVRMGKEFSDPYSMRTLF